VRTGKTRRPAARRTGQPQPEALGSLGESAQVAAAVEQVVDELAACGFFLAYGESLGAFVPCGEGVDGLLNSREDAVGSGARPCCPCHDEVLHDEGTQAMPGLGGLFTQRSAASQLVPGESTAGRGDLGQDLGVSRQIFLRNRPPFHAAP
jgi:hypothetical protein